MKTWKTINLIREGSVRWGVQLMWNTVITFLLMDPWVGRIFFEFCCKERIIFLLCHVIHVFLAKWAIHLHYGFVEVLWSFWRKVKCCIVVCIWLFSGQEKNYCVQSLYKKTYISECIFHPVLLSTWKHTFIFWKKIYDKFRHWNLSWFCFRKQNSVFVIK